MKKDVLLRMTQVGVVSAALAMMPMAASAQTARHGKNPPPSQSSQSTTTDQNAATPTDQNANQPSADQANQPANADQSAQGTTNPNDMNNPSTARRNTGGSGWGLWGLVGLLGLFGLGGGRRSATTSIRDERDIRRVA